jgi:hypothetical protein
MGHAGPYALAACKINDSFGLRAVLGSGGLVHAEGSLLGLALRAFMVVARV